MKRFSTHRVISYGIQEPILPGRSKSVQASNRELNDLLPIEGEAKRMKLISWELGRSKASDPVCLYDRWGAILHQWPDNYMPTLPDVQKVIAELR